MASKEEFFHSFWDQKLYKARFGCGRVISIMELGETEAGLQQEGSRRRQWQCSENALEFPTLGSMKKKERKRCLVPEPHSKSPPPPPAVGSIKHQLALIVALAVLSMTYRGKRPQREKGTSFQWLFLCALWQCGGPHTWNLYYHTEVGNGWSDRPRTTFLHSKYRDAYNCTLWRLHSIQFLLALCFANARAGA